MKEKYDLEHIEKVLSKPARFPNAPSREKNKLMDDFRILLKHYVSVKNDEKINVLVDIFNTYVVVDEFWDYESLYSDDTYLNGYEFFTRNMPAAIEIVLQEQAKRVQKEESLMKMKNKSKREKVLQQIDILER